MRSRRAVCSVAWVALLLSSSCSAPRWHRELPQNSPEHLIIKVFKPSGNTTPGAYDAIVQTVKNTAEFDKIRKYVDIDDEYDGDETIEVREQARKASSDPRVIAVVGHSRSGMTHAALRFYADAGIPVLMPAATSPYVLQRFDEGGPLPALDAPTGSSSKRFDHALRLLPSDVPDQVAALKMVTQRVLKEDTDNNRRDHKVMLICDTTQRNGSDVYTKPMCDSLLKDREFRHSLTSYRELELDTADVYGLVTDVHAVQANYIMFLGYPELAADILQELSERAPKNDASGYTFITSDACLTQDLSRFRSRLYVTSPINPEQPEQCFPKNIVRKDAIPSYEIYYYDALLIITAAVDDCMNKDGVDRGCLRKYLDDHRTNLKGACETYQVDQGERLNASYHVFSTISCNNETQLRPRWLVHADRKELLDDPQWKCPAPH